MIRICHVCHRSLKRHCLPPTSIANDLYFGPIPNELRKLSLVEEALIARRHAKTWIIHLQDDGSPTSHTTGPSSSSTLSTAQRAFKGHVIVFPAQPESLSPFLPPSLEDVITPMCVVFVGITTPSKDWLLNNARPLIVRREKVRAALQWLLTHNPLYSDVILDEKELNRIPLTDVAPVPIHTQPPTMATLAPGARYDNVEIPLTEDPLTAVLQNMVVTDLHMRDVNTAQITAAALNHLKRSNGDIGAHIQVRHGAEPINHYSDPHLLPLLYPTLFPYGIGGYHRNRRASLSLEKMATHV
ncbi:uncharacterized protein EI90DRAFT_2920895, partial [Cantharellus anzutake]|uniref:uncharacterized protein n=1 Tax=Cantharellus anzutake TaxID=1750568 RepID=UPI001904AD94